MQDPQKFQDRALSNVQDLCAEVHPPFPSFWCVYWGYQLAAGSMLFQFSLHLDGLRADPTGATSRSIRDTDQSYLVAVEFPHLVDVDDGGSHIAHIGTIFVIFRTWATGSLSTRFRAG